MPDYQKGKIYKIVNSTNSHLYIGSTCQSLSVRMGGHRSKARGVIGTAPFHAAMRAIGIEKFKIILISNYPCANREELNSEEFRITNAVIQAGLAVYNSDINGKPSPETRQKISEFKRGVHHSAETRKKIGDAQRGRFGAQHNSFKRGYISFCPPKNAWRFHWRVDGRRICKSFNANKYGFSGARGLALFHQEEVYPIEREDDSAFIQEIKDKLKK